MKNLKQIRHMQATENGVIYCSSDGSKVCVTTRESDGSINNKLIIPAYGYRPTYFIKEKVFNDPTNFIKVLTFDLLLFILAGYLKNMNLFLTSIIFTVFVSFRLFKFFYIAYSMKVSKNLYQTSKYVAASHMAINAYHDLQRIPSLEEVRKYSMFSTDSHLTYIFDITLSQIFLCIFLLLAPNLTFWQVILLAIIVPISISVLAYSGKLNFLQLFVTSLPSKEELEVAIEGIKFFEIAENNVKITWVEE